MESKTEHGCILAVDWGERRIGVAISDETRTLARPLKVVSSGSRKENAVTLARIIDDHNPIEVLVGVTYDSDGSLTPIGRRANRLAEAVRVLVSCPVTIVDEARSTRMAKENKIRIGSSRKSRKGHLDAEAAAVFLQWFLDERAMHG